MWKQREHMMAGVRRAYSSPNTPAHLRPHLAQRIQGGTTMQPMAPRKTIVGPRREEAPYKVVAQRTDSTPRKDVVGSTARPPIKTVVGSTAGPPRKTIVGSTAEPPRKTTPGNLGVGGKNPLGMEAADRRPLSSANPSIVSRNLGRGDGNLGRSVSSMPPRATGPENPTLSWERAERDDGIVAGGMGAAAKSMGRAPRPRSGRNYKPSQFYGE
jgi:hypothetical protein